MADDSIRVLNEYRQHITRACSAKQQLKRLVEQHQTCLVQLQTQQLRLRKARAAAEEAINGHAALLLQQLRERCVDALRGVAQEYSLKQLPLDSSIAILERSVRELEGVAQQLYCGLHKATAADSVDHISSLTEGLYVAVQQGEAVVAQCGQSLTRPGGWPTAEAFCGLQIASKRRSSKQQQQQLQQRVPGTPDLPPEWQKAAGVAARSARHWGGAASKRGDQAVAAAVGQMVYPLSVGSSRSSSPASDTKYITAGRAVSCSSSPMADLRSRSSPLAQQQQQKVSLLPRQWRCKQRAQLRYQQHLEEQQEKHSALQQHQQQQGQQQAAFERLVALAAAAGLGSGLASAADSADTDWVAVLPPSAFPTASTDGDEGATGIVPGVTGKLPGRQSRAQRQAAGAGLLQAGRQREAGLTTDTASSDGPGSSGGWAQQVSHEALQPGMPAHQQQQQQRRRQALDVINPAPTAAVPAGHQPAAGAETAAAAAGTAAAAAAGAKPPSELGGAAAAATGGSAGVYRTQTCTGTGTGAGPGAYAAPARPSGDIQGVQQQLAARSQVVQAAWEEVQQLAQRLSADVLGGGLLPTPLQQEELDRQPSTEHRP